MSEREKPFQLDARILAEYPGLENLSEPVKAAINHLFKDCRLSARQTLKEIESGKPVLNFNFLLETIQDRLNGLKEVENGNPALGKFIADHEVVLEELKAKGKEIISDKKKGVDFIYR